MAATLPFMLWRLSIGQSFWADELFSVKMAVRPVKEIIELSKFEAHPPAYYVLLHYWIGALKAIGLGEGVFQARSLNLVGWLILVVASWKGATRLLGTSAGPVAAAAICCSTMVGDIVRDVRGYAFAVPALFTAGIVLLVLLTERREELTRRRQVLLWSSYCASLILALWMHMFSALVATLFGLTWVFILVRDRKWRSSFAIAGAAAHVIAACSFIPWLLQLKYQLAFMGESIIPGATPATLGNLVKVFTVWFTFGRVQAGSLLVSAVGIAVGAAVVAAFLSTGIAAAKHRDQSVISRKYFTVTGLALAWSMLYVLGIWTIHKSGLALAFHGPRYTSLVQPLWILGLFCCAALYDEAGSTRRMPLLLTIWIACSAVGWAQRIGEDHSQDYTIEWTELRKTGLLDGETIHVLAPETIPYNKWYLDGLNIVPAAELTAAKLSNSRFIVVLPTCWRDQLSINDLVLLYMIQGQQLGKVETIPIARGGPVARMFVYVVDGNPKQIEKNLLVAPAPLVPEYPPDAVGTAWSVDQKLEDGFRRLEPVGPRYLMRPGMKEECRIRFVGKLAAGSYKATICLARRPYPQAEQEMKLEWLEIGEPEVFKVSPGPSRLEFELQLAEPLENPVLIVRHPVWRLRDFGNSNDPRAQTFHFDRAWIEPARASTPQE